MENNQDNHLNNLLEEALDDLLGDGEQKLPSPSGDGEQRVPNLLGGGEQKVSNLSGDGQQKVPKDDGSGFGPIQEEEMNKFFQSMAEKLKDEMPNIDPNESIPQIFDLMQNLLSKQLLYPALKELSPKFDEWLKKNSPGLSKTDKKRYRKQKDIIDEIIYVFDDEELDDREKFEKNLDLMEKMQTLGSPPKELTVPEGMNKCSIM